MQAIRRRSPVRAQESGLDQSQQNPAAAHDALANRDFGQRHLGYLGLERSEQYGLCQRLTTEVWGMTASS